MPRTLLIDNYDSFTYNVADLLARVNGEPPTVVTNDCAWEALDFTTYDNVVISPGPGNPTVPGDFGISARAIAESGLPVLGVCLGHQGLCAAFGANVVRLSQPIHGQVSEIHHVGRDLFAGLPSPMRVVRYHSLVAVDVPDELEVLAYTAAGLIMAVRHRDRPLWGVQFHPESIATEHGAALLENFCELSVATNRPRSRLLTPNRAAHAKPSNPAYVVEHRRIEHHPEPGVLYQHLFDGRRGSFWLDRSTATEPTSRFTVMGDATGPLAECLTYDVTTKRLSITRDGTETEHRVSSLFDYLDRQLCHRAVRQVPELPFDFHLGYVGYLGYELKAETGGLNTHQSAQPDARLVFADRAVVIDHHRGCSYLIALATMPGDPHNRIWFSRTAALLEAIAPAHDRDRPTPMTDRADENPFTLRHDAHAYQSRIEESLDLIRAGETYEVCLTNTAQIQQPVDPLTIFDRARELNPAPYAALLEFDEIAVISASPERFLRVWGDRVVESRPIKGTRSRGATAEDDRRLRDALQDSEKDRAENLMIVDLVRNDLSRVCAPGTVYVSELFGIESYPSVHQMVSTVRGTLRADMQPVDAIRALFPAGSMTGAPKIRTMEILDRLEGGPRGVYSGAIGYLSLSGSVDLSVVIRTMIAAGGVVEFGIGGAITALSDPVDEYQETLVKAVSSQQVLAAISAASRAVHS